MKIKMTKKYYIVLWETGKTIWLLWLICRIIET